VFGPKFELPTLLGGRRVDSHRSQPLQMVATSIRIDDVNGLVATLEAVLDERKQHTILFVAAVEECTHMPCFTELGGRQREWCRERLHGLLLKWISYNAVWKVSSSGVVV